MPHHAGDTQEIAEIGRLLCSILPILQMIKYSRNRDNQESSLCPGHTNRGCYPLNYLGSALWERRYWLHKSVPGKHHMGLGICKIVWEKPGQSFFWFLFFVSRSRAFTSDMGSYSGSILANLVSYSSSIYFSL